VPQFVPQFHARVIHSLRLLGDAEPFACTYGVKVTDPPASQSPSDLAAELDQIWALRMMVAFSTQLTLAQTEIYWQNVALPGAPAIGAHTSNVQGSNAGSNSLLPQNTALLAHKRTALGGRTGRGRMYLPAVDQDWVSNTGVVLASIVTSFTAALESVRTDILASQNFDGMYLFHDAPLIGPAIQPTLITSLNLDGVCATQRRRLRR
jgi:hypothetical protein